MKYRKKPLIVEAVQFTGENFREIRDTLTPKNEESPLGLLANGNIQVWTLEGPLRANKGDWIIKGIMGECYPCKPDIFEATYEEVK